MARPTSLTEEVLTKLDAIADDGLSIQDACKQAGISDDSFRRWESSTDEDDHLVRFRGMAARVRARANQGMLDKCDGVIQSALDSADVRPGEKAALAIQFKRLMSAHKIEVTGKDGGPIEIEDARRKLTAGLDRLKPKP